MRAGFPHSDILGSKLACQLPEAYRRLQRPSSPVVAKASTTCTCSLDPITLSTLDEVRRKQDRQRSAGYRGAWYNSQCNHYPDESGLRVRIRFTSSELLKSSRTKLTAKPILRWLGGELCARKPGPGGANRDRTGDLLLAKQALSQLSYGPGLVVLKVVLP